MHYTFMGLPGDPVVKNMPGNTGDERGASLIPGSGRSSREGNGQPTPVFLPGESHGQRSLVGYSSWGHKELDTTEQLSLSLFWTSLMAQPVRSLPAMQEIWI